MPSSFTFRVLGTPVPQGSVKAYGSRVVANNREALGSWRTDVASAAHRARPDDWNKSAAVSLRCEFVFPRPKSHYGTGGNAGPGGGAVPSRARSGTPVVSKTVQLTLSSESGRPCPLSSAKWCVP